MTSAFFLGAFVTAHFFMPRSSIHWIHSLSPFTMGRPLSTAQQLSHLEHWSKLEKTHVCLQVTWVEPCIQGSADDSRPEAQYFVLAI